MTAFDEAKERNLEKLELYVPIVDRVHGKDHPEFHDVRKFFEEILVKVKAAGSQKPGLSAEFKQLREVTNNFTIPADVCESYEAVYSMLAEMDEAYQAE